MDMADIIVGGILLAIVVAAVRYIRKAKKNGVKCIGCPEGCKCGTHNSHSSCSCGCHSEQ